MSGIQLADLARQRRPDLRIIYMTGYVRGAGEPGAQIDPSHPVLNKPFTRDALIQRVHEALAVHSDPLPIP
jgi:CheY-like chemotaxis protein